MSDVAGMFDRLGQATTRVGTKSDIPVAIPDATAEGRSEDKTVTAVMTGGKIVSVTIDPHVLRKGNAEVSDRVVEAVNAAIDAHTAAMLAAFEAPDTDFGQLRRELTDIGQQAQDSFASHMGAMRQMLDQATKRVTEP